MKIKLKTSHGGFKRGSVVDWPDGVANLLVSRGVAEAHVEVQSVQRAVTQDRMETATVDRNGHSKRKVKR